MLILTKYLEFEIINVSLIQTKIMIKKGVNNNDDENTRNSPYYGDCR